MVQGFGLLIFRVKDVDALTQFYHQALGLEVLRTTPGRIAVLATPSGPNIEIAAGGDLVPPVTDRTQAPTAPVFRVHDVQGAVDSVVAHGGRVVNAPFHIGGQTVAYVADPEGRVFGLSTIPV